MNLDTMPICSSLDDAFMRIQSVPSSMHEHMPFIRDCASRAQSVLELGVNQGTSCVALLAGLLPGGRMVSVDIQGPLTPLRFVLEWCADAVRQRNWVFMQSDSIAALGRLLLWGERFDLVFLDTSHRYADTVVELDMIESVLRPGGVILCHDTVSELDVARAIATFNATRHWRYENRTNCHGLGILTSP